MNASEAKAFAFRFTANKIRKRRESIACESAGKHCVPHRSIERHLLPRSTAFSRLKRKPIHLNCTGTLRLSISLFLFLFFMRTEHTRTLAMNDSVSVRAAFLLQLIKVVEIHERNKANTHLVVLTIDTRCGLRRHDSVARDDSQYSQMHVAERKHKFNNDKAILSCTFSGAVCEHSRA